MSDSERAYNPSFNVALSDGVRAELAALAKRAERSVGGEVRVAIAEHLDRVRQLDGEERKP